MQKIAFFFITVLTTLVIFSCSKDNDLKTIPEAQGISLDDGILRFETFKEFNDVLLSLQEKTDNELLAWENQFPSYHSYRSVFNKAVEELEAIDIDNEKAITSKINEYATQLLVGEDGEFTTPARSYPLSTLLTIDGLVFVENVLHRFTADQQIMSIHEDKEAVMRSTEAAEDQGLFVAKTLTISPSARTTCTNTASADNGYSINNNKKYKIYGSAQVNTLWNPVVLQEQPGVVHHYTLNYNIAMYHKTYKKNIFGNYKGNKHCSSGSLPNTFESGWQVNHSALGNLHGGFGWGYPECRSSHTTYVSNPNGQLYVWPSQTGNFADATFQYIAFRVHTAKVPPIASNPDPMDIWCDFR